MHASHIKYLHLVIVQGMPQATISAAEARVLGKPTSAGCTHDVAKPYMTSNKWSYKSRNWELSYDTDWV